MNSREVYDFLLGHNLCDTWRSLLVGAESKLDFVSASLSGQGIEFLLNRKEITVDWIKGEFSEYLNKEVDLFDGRKGMLVADLKGYKQISSNVDVLHFMDSIAVLKVDDWYVGEITVSRGSKIIIEVCSDVILNINIHDDSEVNIVGTHKVKDAVVNVRCYSGICKDLLSGNNNKVFIYGSI